MTNNNKISEKDGLKVLNLSHNTYASVIIMDFLCEDFSLQNLTKIDEKTFMNEV